jgi:hypothetical protein
VASEPYLSLLSGFEGEAGDLIPILQRIQEKDGYLSETGIREVSEFLRVSENQVFGVASFYSQFRFSAPGRHSIRVCLGTACHVRSGQILARGKRPPTDASTSSAWRAWDAVPWPRSFRSTMKFTAE